MLQRFKLRLGDGTVLGVDQEGLRTWAVDGKAMVQAADSRHWYPLKEFLAAQYVAARRAARQRAKESSGTPKPLPLVYPTPRGARSPQAPEEPHAVTEEPPAPTTDTPPFLAEPLDLTAPGAAIDLAAEAPAADEAPFAAAPEPEAAPDLALSDVAMAAAVEPVDPVAASALAEPAVSSKPFVPSDPVLYAEPVPSVEPLLLEDLRGEIVSLEPPPVLVTKGGPTWITDDAPSMFPPPLEAPEVLVTAVGSSPEIEREEALFVGTPAGVQTLADEPARPPEPRPVVRPPAPVQPPAPRPSLQTLADDPGPARTEATKPARSPLDDLPVIPLKPLDDGPALPARGAAREEPTVFEEAAPRDELEARLRRWLSGAYAAYDAVLTAGITWLKQTLAARGGASPRSFEEPSLRRVEAKPALAAREPSLGPPPALHELPVIRLAHVPETALSGDLYEAEGRLAMARRWAPRVALVIGVVAVAAFALLQRETWVPQAGRLGQAALTQLDRAQRSREMSVHRRQALQEASERLPHLSPGTIQLLTAGAPDEALDPVELFRTSSDAADRGAAALAPEETRELKEILAELRKALRPSERERLREYHAARVRRVVFPFEGADVTELFARAAYALPAPRLERLQELLGKAIAAGVRPPDSVAPGAETGATR